MNICRKVLALTAMLLNVTIPMPLLADVPLRAPPGYSVEQIAPPQGAIFEPEALGFDANGSLYVTTRRGDVWMRSAGTQHWQRFAEGLFEPLGLYVDPESQHLFVVQRAEVTELVDENRDGAADLYKRVGAGWGYSGNYHEYAYGPVRDRDGRFLVTLNLSHLRGSSMIRAARYRGWAVQITPQGGFIPYASGLRSPAGLGANADGDIFITDNQGDWVPTSALFHLVKGRFYGHPSSLADSPEYRGKDLDHVPIEELRKQRTLPAIWIPYGELANSPGEPSFNYTQGKFGPFEGQIFIGDQTRSNLIRAVIEKIEGEYQGAVFNFVEGFESGVIRGRFAKDGSYWVGEIDHGWASNGGHPGALERVVWDGKTIPFEMQSIHLTSTGFQITFTKPIDATTLSPAAFEISHWHYNYWPKYGSPKVDEISVTPTHIKVSPDGLAVELYLPLVTGEVYRIRSGVRSARGEGQTNDTGWYTLNHLRPAIE